MAKSKIRDELLDELLQGAKTQEALFGPEASVVTSNVAIGGHFKSSQRMGRDGWRLRLGVGGVQVRGFGTPAAGSEFEDVGMV